LPGGGRNHDGLHANSEIAAADSALVQQFVRNAVEGGDRDGCRRPGRHGRRERRRGRVGGGRAVGLRCVDRDAHQPSHGHGERHAALRFFNASAPASPFTDVGSLASALRALICDCRRRHPTVQFLWCQ